jgi:hypothetical protein
MIEVYDPEAPEAPVLIHPGNLSGHTRWKYRPTAVRLNCAELLHTLLRIPAALDIASDVGEDDARALREAHEASVVDIQEQATALEAAGLVSIEALAAASRMPSAIPEGTAAKLKAWARGHRLPNGAASVDLSGPDEQHPAASHTPETPPDAPAESPVDDSPAVEQEAPRKKQRAGAKG